MAEKTNRGEKKKMPSAHVLEEKQAVVAKLVEQLKNAKAGVVCDYKGITVENDTALRRSLRKAGVEYVVVKNTLLRRAVREVGLEGLEPYLKGMSSVALSNDDPVAPAKVLSEYSKKTKGAFALKAGFVEGKVIGDQGVSALADLPPREVLIATVLGTLNAPITGFVTVLNANIRGLAVALQAIAEKKAN